MQRTLRIAAVVLFVIFIIAMIGVFFVVLRRWGSPMQLEISEVTQTATLVETQPVKEIEQKTCGGNGLMRLVVIGRASGNEEGLYGADAVRLVVVNFDAPSAGILSLPVEMLVDTPVIEDQGVLRTTISNLYQKAWEKAVDEPEMTRKYTATEALAQTIVDNFGFVPDHYLTIEEEAFLEFVGIVAPIPVELTSAVDGSVEGYGVYQAGTNMLNAQQALNLARMLHPDGQTEPDYRGRLARQDAVLAGLLESFKTVEASELDDLAKSLQNAVTTDLSINQALNLTCMVDLVGAEVDILAAEVDDDANTVKDLIGEIEGGN